MIAPTHHSLVLKTALKLQPLLPFLVLNVNKRVQMLWLTAGFLLQQLSLAVDDTQDQQGQEHGGQSAADDCGQGHVPRTGHHHGQWHQVHTPAACEDDRGKEMNVKYSWTTGWIPWWWAAFAVYIRKT